MLILKQSTASQAVLLGPFVDSTDGVTAETGLTIANTDVRVSKNGANIVAKNSGGGTHDENGFYQITLDATDTDTVGTLQVHCTMSGALPVFAEFQVVEEAVYDDVFASGAAGYNTTTPPTAAAVRTEIDSNSTQLAAIVADTNELQTDDVPGLISALNDISTAQVNAEVVDAIATDARSEPGSVPAANASMAAKVDWLFALARNKITQTSSTQTLRNDADSGSIATASVSDDGTTFTRGEFS